jgi:hypothetical protein
MRLPTLSEALDDQTGEKAGRLLAAMLANLRTQEKQVMKKSHVFEATDGKTFVTSEECKRHEELANLALLEGLSPEDIHEAIARTNIPLADAIERVGNIIADKRRESGELRHAAKTTGPLVAMEKIKKNMKSIS